MRHSQARSSVCVNAGLLEPCTDLTTVHQVKIAEPVLLVAHPENLSTALDVMKKAGLSEDRLILIEAPDSSIPTVASLLEASGSYPPLVEPQFKEGEAKSTLAFLCFSSGTTGLPKVSIPSILQEFIS